MYKSSQKQSGKVSLLTSYVEAYGDVVMRHRAKLAEQARRMEAEERDLAKSQFLANMSHELRTPLNAIIGFSQIMHDCEKLDVSREKIIEYSGYINDTAEHLLNIINNLLDISKIQSGHQTISVDEVNPHELMRVCITLLSGAAGQSGVKIENRTPEDFPIIEGDPVRLKQVFSNILSNAVNCMPDGGEVVIRATQENANKAVFDISDTGPGMTPEEIEIANQPFRQVEGDLDRRLNGTGLGIPIARGMVELHSGQFEILSEKGRGTTVRITLPVHQQSEKQEIRRAGERD